jgi:hypothetical protein
MSYSTPLVNYETIKVHDTDVLLGSQCKASFQHPYNKINITMTPTNCSLSQFDVRVTRSEDPWDIDQGVLAYRATNLTRNMSHSFSIEVNETNFNQGIGTYRIGLYARNALDNSWDVTYLFFALGSEQFILADGSTFEVLTTRNALD